MNKFFIILLSALSLASARAQVIINEYSAANYSDVDFLPGPGTAYEDWLELYNTSATAFDLSGYFLSDKINNLQKWQFPQESLALY